MCRLVLPGVRTGFPGGNCVHCLTHATGAKVFLAGESGTVVPLLTSAAPATWRPSHAGAGHAFAHGRSHDNAVCRPIIRGQGAADHSVLSIGGAQHVRHLAIGCVLVRAVRQRQRNVVEATGP